MSAQRIEISDNSFDKDLLSKDQLACLAPFAGISLQDLNKREKQLLIFPHCLGAHDDGIEEQHLFDVTGGKLKTTNVMGFFSVNDIHVAIHSRFDNSEHQYFLHYMLQKVFGMNILNLKTGMDAENLWEFLIYLFPYCLKRALRQGLIKAYRQYHYNDAKVRGCIDVARHLKVNLPFSGKIAYHTREHSSDNPLMQLIRHTIEFIKSNQQSSMILSNSTAIKEAVSQVVCATPSYQGLERRKVIAQNLRGVRHPYFTEYAVLQELCLQILRYEKISYGKDEQQIQGIVFDGAWLWEEYLATMLTELGFEHPENKTGRGRRYLYTDHSGWYYPDFIRDELVFDAKYKRVENGIQREDRYQMISYMHVLKAKCGYLILPSPLEKYEIPPPERVLNGHGGTLGVLTFDIPSQHENWDNFVLRMTDSENHFREIMQTLEQKNNCVEEQGYDTAKCD